MKLKLLIALTLLFFLNGLQFHAQLPSYLPTNGLVAWYPFNGNANDESGNGNDGTTFNTQPTTDRFGNGNSAYDFNGSTSYINCGNQFFNSVNYCSISLWMKTTTFSSTTKNLCNKRREIAGDGIGILMIGSSVCGMLNRDPQTFSNNGYSTCTPYSSTGWNHVVLVNNNSVLSIYLNSTLIDTQTLTPGPTIPGMPMYIGKGFDYDIGGGNRAYSGQLDDCSFYNRVLTSEEIANLFNATYSNTGGGGNSNATSAPNGIPYQAEVRNESGEVLANANVNVRFTLHELTANGTVSYQETHASTTNELGLFAATIGAGSAAQGTFAGINWSQTTKFLQVEVDTGNGYITIGNQQLMSVPYAQYAQKARRLDTQDLPVFENNTLALAGGLQAGELYRTSLGDLKVVY